MVNREIVMDYILSCLQDLVENGVEIKPDSDLVNDLGLESIKVMDLLMMLEDRFDISIPINILLDVKTPAQLMETARQATTDTGRDQYLSRINRSS